MPSSAELEAPTEKKVILAFRLQSVLVIMAILAVGGGGISLTTTAFQIAFLYLASNALLTFVPDKYYQTKTLIGAIGIVDVLFVSSCIRLSGDIAGDIYLLYFLAIFMAALSRDLRTTVVAAVVISAVYLWVSFSTLGPQSIMTPGFLLRIPLFFVTAFFAGFLTNQARQREKLHQETKQIANQLEERLEYELKREEEVISRYHSLSERHQNLISNINTGVIVVDETALITTFNPEAERLTGLTAPQVLGKKIADFEELAPFAATIRDILLPSTSRVPTESDCAFRMKDGRLVKVGVSISPMYGENMAPAGATIAMRDITELDGLREAIRRSERLACIGGTSLCIIRRIRDQLKSIISIAGIQHERTDVSDSLHQSAEAILDEAEIMDETILETIQFIRQEETPFEALDLNEIVQLCVSGLRRELERQSISTTLDMDPYLPCVLGSPLQLRQVIIQILLNAMEAIEHDGGIKIRTRAENGHILCNIEDNGPGVPLKMRDRLFEPLATSKAGGTGIGLFISHRIVLEHGGRIELLGSSGKGCVIEMRLPVLTSDHASEKRVVPRQKAAA